MQHHRVGQTLRTTRVGLHLADALERCRELAARLLLVIVDGGTMIADPPRAAELAPRLTANFQTVIAEAADNPRVKFLRAFMSFYRPGSTRAAKDIFQYFPITAPAGKVFAAGRSDPIKHARRPCVGSTQIA